MYYDSPLFFYYVNNKILFIVIVSSYMLGRKLNNVQNAKLEFESIKGTEEESVSHKELSYVVDYFHTH